MTPDSPALEVQVIDRLRALGQTIVTAESSTGGLITKRLTDISGSSACVLGGVVAYADDIKEKVLGVQKQTLIDYGAVSEPVAQQMAEGARRLFGSDFALSVTGIAGPTGATPTKPVGLHYIGLSAASGTRVRRYVWPGDRDHNRAAAADAALRLLLAVLDGVE
jgi:nicotinamide-nucleotide amidase